MLHASGFAGCVETCVIDTQISWHSIPIHKRICEAHSNSILSFSTCIYIRVCILNVSFHIGLKKCACYDQVQDFIIDFCCSSNIYIVNAFWSQDFMYLWILRIVGSLAKNH